MSGLAGTSSVLRFPRPLRRSVGFERVDPHSSRNAQAVPHARRPGVPAAPRRAALHPDVLPGIQGDDEGDNISRLNASYSELTALYWMWKNCDADYKGLVHYRRLFASPSLANRLRKDRFVRIASGKEIREALKKTGAVVPRSRNYYIETMHSHYAHTLDGSHLDVMRDILMSKAPEYVPMFDRCMASTSGHMFNMLVMRADLFDAYCAWLFPLIDELASQIDASAYTPFEKRYPGRVSELLLDVWLKTNGQDVVELPLTSPEPTDWGKKGKGFLMAKFAGRKYAKSF